MPVTTFNQPLPFLASDYETRKDYQIGAGQVLLSGRVLTLDAATNTLVGANTGNIPHSILLNDTDTTAGAVFAPVVVECDFVIETLIDCGTATPDEFREALRGKGIILGKPNN